MTTRLGAVERLSLRLLIETEHPPHALAGGCRAGRKPRRLDASRRAVAQLEFPHSCGGDRARQMRCTTKTLIRIRSAMTCSHPEFDPAQPRFRSLIPPSG